MISLPTTTENGDKVMAHSIAKALSISTDELIKYAQSMQIKITSAQHILALDEGQRLADFIHVAKQKLHFDSDEWVSHCNIDDFHNIIRFIDQTLQVIDTQMEQHCAILAHSNDAHQELLLLPMDHKHLLEIKVYLLSKFDFSLELLKDKLLFMKSEALTFLDQVDASSSLWQDETLSHRTIHFQFTATKIVRLYEAQMTKIDRFAKIESFFMPLLQAVKSVQQADEKFRTTDKEKLSRVLENAYLGDEQPVLYAEWEKEIDQLNQLYMQFIQAYFIGKISESMVLNVFAIIQQIKDDLEDFYLTLRAGLVTKYKDNSKSRLLQEVATKDKLFKIYQKSAEIIKTIDVQTKKLDEIEEVKKHRLSKN